MIVSPVGLADRIPVAEDDLDVLRMVADHRHDRVVGLLGHLSQGLGDGDACRLRLLAATGEGVVPDDVEAGPVQIDGHGQPHGPEADEPDLLAHAAVLSW